MNNDWEVSEPGSDENKCKCECTCAAGLVFQITDYGLRRFICQTTVIRPNHSSDKRAQVSSQTARRAAVVDKTGCLQQADSLWFVFCLEVEALFRVAL